MAGVCGGIAEYFRWDPTIVRIAYILLTIFTAFAGLLVYIILWIVMPRS
ncbi:MAG: PspC domain-containing protein [Bacteroidetes bacterium]|nr:PspC domain-containing protein [Bacteroidota bacterium]MDA1121449.1 PspC domain-containing protein [Bacteroidota bacterium]